MPSPPPRLAGLLALAATTLWLAPQSGAQTTETTRVYKWVDENGIAHYTTDPDRIPDALRNRIESLDRGGRAEPEAPAPEPRAAELPPVEPPAGIPTGADEAAPAEAAAGAGEPAPESPAPAIAVPEPRTSPAPSRVDWATRDVVPDAPSSAALLKGGVALTPEQKETLAAEREALDARIAELEAAIRRDENMLKDLISEPDLDADTPIFDRPEFLEISQRLPELQAELDALRSQRAQLEPR
jgi:hypothetical protein